MKAALFLTSLAAGLCAAAPLRMVDRSAPAKKALNARSLVHALREENEALKRELEGLRALAVEHEKRALVCADGSTPTDDSADTSSDSGTTTTSSAATGVAGQNTPGGSQCPAVALQAYNDFQISDGTAGNAAAEANAVFVDPFAGCDLSTVDSDTLDNLDTMAKAAVDAEDAFDSAIDAGDSDALEAGKIKNKVLKLTGEVQVLAIKAAQGDSSASADQATEQAKLTKDIAEDQDAAGTATQSVQFDG